MIQLVVVDYREYNNYGVTLGTCDYCMRQTDIHSAYWTFRDNLTDETIWFSSQVWKRTGVETMPQCSNIPAFSQWLSTSTEATKILHDYNVNTLEDLNSHVIEALLEASGYIQEDY